MFSVFGVFVGCFATVFSVFVALTLSSVFDGFVCCFDIVFSVFDGFVCCFDTVFSVFGVFVCCFDTVFSV